MIENNGLERELSWDDQITEDPNEYIVLSEGEYDFMVESFERARHIPKDSSAKLPACNKAILSIRILSDLAPQGYITVKHNLFLHSRTAGMLSAFFSSIGQKKKGEPLKMNWNLVIGARGRCKVGTKVYNGNTYNEIKSFITKEEVSKPVYTPGTF